MFVLYSTPKGELKSLVVNQSECIKEQIAARENFCANDYLFLVNGDILSSNNLLTGETISVVENVCGGKKGKKKKKNYTTPKHVSHQKKKTKLAYLKLYSIEGGNVVTKNTPCTGSCPKGTFMATHKDRLHCGSCGTMVRLNMDKK